MKLTGSENMFGEKLTYAEVGVLNILRSIRRPVSPKWIKPILRREIPAISLKRLRHAGLITKHGNGYQISLEGRRLMGGCRGRWLFLIRPERRELWNLGMAKLSRGVWVAPCSRILQHRLQDIGLVIEGWSLGVEETWMKHMIPARIGEKIGLASVNIEKAERTAATCGEECLSTIAGRVEAAVRHSVEAMLLAYGLEKADFQPLGSLEHVLGEVGRIAAEVFSEVLKYRPSYRKVVSLISVVADLIKMVDRECWSRIS